MIEVRQAIAQLMEKYDDEYWLKIDREHLSVYCWRHLTSVAGSGEFPHQLTKDLAANGWLGKL
jgi:hypothetical protein